MPERTTPDLRTLAGQLDYLGYHAPDEDARVNHENVNNNFRVLWSNIAESLPDGPGKTRALHAVNDARMQCNNCIANLGA
jgi:hypothetical protein